MAKRTTKVSEALNSLNKNDIYSLMLFTLFKLHDTKEYATISELAYILEGDSLTKFLTYFGGMTIKVPTLKELRRIVQALLLYQHVNIEKGDFKDTLKVVCGDEFREDDIKQCYLKLLEVISDYDFNKE